MNSIPRESLELVGPITVSALDTNGQAVSLASLEVTLLARGTRPTSGWETPQTVDGDLWVLVGPPTRALTPGTYELWGRLTDSPEVPIFPIDRVIIT